MCLCVGVSVCERVGVSVCMCAREFMYRFV